jgi:predicted component of viral defense system (DUF524 family)
MILTDQISIDLSHISPGFSMLLTSTNKEKNALFFDESADQFNEGKIQVFEGKNYFFELKNAAEWSIDERSANGAIRLVNESKGVFNPNIFVGTFEISFVHANTGEREVLQIEVRSTKITYSSSFLVSAVERERSEYQQMLSALTDYSVELIMQYDVPNKQTFESGEDYLDSDGLYQRFLFLQSLLEGSEFENAIQQIIQSPTTNWSSENEELDVARVKKFGSKQIREITTRGERIVWPNGVVGIDSLPSRVTSSRKVETVDTVENRFIKYVVQTYLSVLENISERLGKTSRSLEKERIEGAIQKIEHLLHQAFFRKIGELSKLEINSPVLQRKSGYREVLRGWLKFNLIAQLSWRFDENNQLFSGGKKNIAKLYEYWVFFVLFNTLTKRYITSSSKSSAEWIKSLITADKNGLVLLLQEGRRQVFEFTHERNGRKLKIKFFYNRLFRGGVEYQDAVDGSYSKSFRPDYTISIWPDDLNEKEAEGSELMVHIHFDAKYKLDMGWTNGNERENESLSDEELNAKLQAEKDAEVSGSFKNVDLYKMHAYKDAIRRTGGAYIIYPGSSSKKDSYKGFHELIPGVGAFPVRPSSEIENSTSIQSFIDGVIENLEDTISQRERYSRQKRKIFGSKPISLQDQLLKRVAQEIGIENSLDDTHVLVGFCKSDEHLNWIRKNHKYNIRFGGGYLVNGEMATAKFLILYREVKNSIEFENGFIFELNSQQSRIVIKDELISLGYPNPFEEQYLLYSIQKEIPLANHSFVFNDDIQDLKDTFTDHSSRKLPFAVSLTELLAVRK